MDISGWVKESASQIRQDGWDGAVDSARPVYHKVLSQYNRVQPPGTPIYDREWDLLIIVDACRLDLMREVAPAYDYIDQVDSIKSLDSTTAFWMRKTFVDDYRSEMAETAYLCGNPFSADQLDPNQFDTLEELWRTSWVDPGTVPPRAITDATIRKMRDDPPSRVIAHYMQPHCPFIPSPELSKGKEIDKFGNQDWRDVWEKLRDGDLTEQEVWEGYRANLELVLNDIFLLLENVDADRVIISSDHGNAMGEFHVWGHPPAMPHDCLRIVPWIQTTATDLGEYKPEEEAESDVDIDREDQLEALGYA